MTDPNLIAVGHLVRLLIDNVTLDNHALAEQCGLGYLTVCRYTAAIYHAGGAHVSRVLVDRNGRQTIRVFRLGEGVDAQPVKETQSQKMKRLRRKWKRERIDDQTTRHYQGELT